MARYHTPHFGPNAGKLCKDGEPLGEPTQPLRVLVALPDGTVCDDGWDEGEISNAPTRDSIAKLANELHKAGISNADERAHACAIRWDRGVRDGKISRPK